MEKERFIVPSIQIIEFAENNILTASIILPDDDDM